MSKLENETSLKVLSKRHYEILKAAADRIVPQASEIHGIDLAQKIDSTLANVPKEYGQDLKLLLLVFEYGAPFLCQVFKRFTNMTPEEKDSYLERWERSRIPFQRMGFQAIKRLTLAAFYGSEESWPGIGYRGPWLDKGYPYDYPGKGIQLPS